MLFSFNATNPDFSLKNLNLWLTGSKEQTFFEEHILQQNGTVTLDNNNGSIAIKSWSLNKIAIEATKKISDKSNEDFILSTNATPDYVTINTSSQETSDSITYKLIVPHHTTLNVKTLNGSIKIKNVHGVINATTAKGTITIQNAKNSIHASATGSIKTTISMLNPEHDYIFKSSRGSIALTMPITSNALLKATTTYGAIISEHFVTLNPITLTLNKQTWESLKRHINGKIGSGGPLLELTAYNGISLLQQ